MKMMYIAVEEVKSGDSFWGMQSENLEQVRKDLANSCAHCTESEKAKRTFYIVGYEYPEDMDFEDWADEQMCLPDPVFYEEYKKYNVNYESGQSRYGTTPVDFMMIVEPIKNSDMDWETSHLYCEVELTDDDFDEDGNETSESDYRHYDQLKESVISLASSVGISREQLVFYRD